MDHVLIGVTSALIAFVSALLGIGGAVLLIPALLVVAPGTGVGEITGATSVQVLATTLVGVGVHGSRGAVARRLVVVMGIATAGAAFAGAVVSGQVSGDWLLAAFTVLASLAAVLLLLPPRGREGTDGGDFSVGRAVFLSVGIGFWGGLVGAPGGFLLVPAMIHGLRIPTRIAVGSALGVVLLSAVTTSGGKLAAGLVPPVLTAVVVAGAIPGAALGAHLSRRVSVAWLRRLLALVMAGVAVRLWIQILG